MRKTRQGYILEIGKKKVETDEFTGQEKITFPTVKTIRVPLCKYPLDGKFPTGFKIDIDLKEALDRLSEVEDSIEMMDKGRGKEILLEIINENKEEEKYLSTGKYAKKYGITSTTVRNWIGDGKLEYYTIPGRGKGDEYRIKDAEPSFKKVLKKF